MTGAEIVSQAVAQDQRLLVAAVHQLVQPLPVALQMRSRIEAALDQDAAAVPVIALSFRAMPVMQERALDMAEIAAQVANGTVLPLKDGAAIAGRHAGVYRLFRFADDGAGHEPIRLADDRDIEQPADRIEGGAAHCPRIAGMMIIGDA